ncbi:glycosyltransferase [Allostreptomyces psammosilenae]|uniref:D-inositol 3-phosphate glycosyltransferase n=1 Tax=Allostreptomyces psammosilenae TaxID=1892865 RepID=A0A853A2W4_9ACTN|nr:glycosyltransferase [Allostreptomyces psammosilenae]NYI08477.1 glycosyltransferase involved in cell wall biosynthesis [Allostreptomyces psammosilenae]
MPDHTADPHRTPTGRSGRRLAVVTPWYPSENNPFAGAFVQAATAAVAPRFAEVDVYHPEDWAGPARPLHAEVVRTALERLVGRPGRAPVGIEPVPLPEGRLTRVPVPVFPRRDYAAWGLAHERALRSVLPTGRVEAEVVHAHVGVYGGWAATRLARPDARVVLTEHATFLRRVLRQPEARRMYEEVLERVEVLMCVGGYLRGQLAGYFPRHAHKFRIVPNVVDFAALPPRPEPVRALDRWLFVGRLIEQKGVPVLLEAFALAARENPRATLTLVGSGRLEEALRARADELGLAGRVRFLGPVPPQEIAACLHAHDLLVHASRFETFGMTVVEAVATGTPVLVTRSYGPEETLAGLDGVAGRLVDVSDDPHVLLEGYRWLRAGLGRLDMARARAVLRDRYGAEAVADRLAAVYAGREPAPVPGVEAPGDDGAVGAAVPEAAGRTSVSGGVPGEGATAVPHRPAVQPSGPEGDSVPEGAGGEPMAGEPPEPPAGASGVAGGDSTRRAPGTPVTAPGAGAALSAPAAATDPADWSIPAVLARWAVPVGPVEPASPASPAAATASGATVSAGAVAPAAGVEAQAPARVVLLALNTQRARRIKNHAAYLVARGVAVDLVTVHADPWRELGLDPRVRIFTLREGEGRHPIPRGERLLAYRVPRKALALLRTRVDATPRGRRVELAAAVLEMAHTRVADAFHRKLFIRAYRVIRPYLLWRVARAHVLERLRAERADLVVVCDANAIPIGWHLARRHPELEVSLSLDRERFAARTVVDPGVDPSRFAAPVEPRPVEPRPGEDDARPGADARPGTDRRARPVPGRGSRGGVPGVAAADVTASEATASEVAASEVALAESAAADGTSRAARRPRGAGGAPSGPRPTGPHRDGGLADATPHTDS